LIKLLPKLLVTFILVKGSVLAQDFEVAPVRLDFNAEPGENQTKVVTVKNHSNKKTSFIITLADFMPSESGERKIMAPNSTKRSCANWLNINPSFFELNPGEESQIQVSMLVPNDEFGAAWCEMYFQTTVEQTSWSADKALGTGLMVSGRIGVLIFQSPKSNTNNLLKISNLIEVDRGAAKDRKFKAIIENLGDKVTKCKVYLIASNMETAEERQFEPQEFETYPKMSRTIELSLPDVLPNGSYALAAILDYGPKYSLEGAQLLIQVKKQAATPDSSVIK